MKAKCKCGCIWDYSYDDMKIEPDGHDLVITLYCPNCNHQSFAYSPNDLVEKVSPSYVDTHHSLKYTWE